MFSVIDFTEHWASIYKPILHNNKGRRSERRKRFYCIESVDKLMNLAKEIPSMDGPFVAMETNIGGDISEKYMYPEYAVYLFVQGKPLAQANDGEDTLAKREAMRHAMAFLNYARQEQRLHEDDRNSPLLGVDLDRVHFETFGPFFNRWFCVGIGFSQVTNFSRCVNGDDYLSDDDDHNQV